MSSLRKIEANRRNAQASTGPRTPEGRAAASGNAYKHGLRASKTRLYFESFDDFQRIGRDLTAEWLPATPTEANLVEQMAIAEAKLIRLERNMNHAFLQSEFMLMIGCEAKYTEPDGRIRPPDIVDLREFEIQKFINGISQHIARVERAWHKALDSLQKLQDRRRKEAALNLPAEDTTAADTRQAAAEPEQVTSAILEMPIKNDVTSHRSGDQTPPNEVDLLFTEAWLNSAPD